MADNANNTENLLDANELADVNGGSLMNGGAFEGPGAGDGWISSKDLTPSGIGYIHNYHGQVVGKVDGDKYLYWPCPKCSKPMHKGVCSFLFCDPCDYSPQHEVTQKEWTGTRAQLAFASA